MLSTRILWVCLPLFLINLQPSEPYLSEYLTSFGGIPADKLSNLLWPVNSIATLVLILPTTIFAVLFGSRNVVLCGLLARMVVRNLLLFGAHSTAAGVCGQVLYAFASSTMVAYWALSYSVVPPSAVVTVTVAVRAAYHAGNIVGCLVGELLVALHQPLRLLFVLSLLCTTSGLGAFIFGFPSNQSLQASPRTSPHSCRHAATAVLQRAQKLVRSVALFRVCAPPAVALIIWWVLSSGVAAVVGNFGQSILLGTAVWRDDEPMRTSTPISITPTVSASPLKKNLSSGVHFGFAEAIAETAMFIGAVAALLLRTKVLALDWGCVWLVAGSSVVGVVSASLLCLMPQSGLRAQAVAACSEAILLGALSFGSAVAAAGCTAAAERAFSIYNRCHDAVVQNGAVIALASSPSGSVACASSETDTLRQPPSYDDHIHADEMHPLNDGDEESETDRLLGPSETHVAIQSSHDKYPRTALAVRGAASCPEDLELRDKTTWPEVLPEPELPTGAEEVILLETDEAALAMLFGCITVGGTALAAAVQQVALETCKEHQTLSFVCQHVTSCDVAVVLAMGWLLAASVVCAAAVFGYFAVHRGCDKS